METVSCHVCGVDNAVLLYKGHDRLLGGAEAFALVRCRRCGLIYLNPRPTPDEMERYYPSNYDPYTRRNEVVSWCDRLRYRVAIERMCRIAAGRQAPGRLLDIGCGDGDFLAGMQQRGWQVCGLDTSLVAVDLARSKGLDVFLGPLDQASYSEASFDLITMWDVLEHLHDPGAYLAHIRRLLTPAGRFVVTLPNPHSLDFRIFGSLWTGLDIPRHLYIFVRPALLALLNQAGLKVESARCKFGGQWVSQRSTEWWIDERVSNENLKQRLKRLIHSQAWYWLWWPFYLCVDCWNLGSSITYRCRLAE